MFDWFGRKSDYSNVVKFPEQIKSTTPYIEQPQPEELHYTIGVTSEDRIALKIGYSTLTMSKTGCEDLIEQLEVFVKQLKQRETDA
jgi:hypothetical protein